MLPNIKKAIRDRETVAIGGGEFNHDELQQVARMLESHSELLAALKQADAWVAMYHNEPGHDAASRCMSKVIRAAIASAE